MAITEIEKTQARAQARGIRNKFHNQQVRDRYGSNDAILKACLIEPWDTEPEITNKILTFSLILQNFTPIVSEKISFRNKAKTKNKQDENEERSSGEIWAQIHIKFKERFIKDRTTGLMKPLGQRRITVNNINPELLINQEESKKKIKNLLDNETILYGRNYVSYNFLNGKGIRLEHVGSNVKGIKLIEKFVSLTKEEHQQPGEVKKNIFILIVPELNTPSLDTDRLLGHFFKITFHQQIGKKSGKLLTIMLNNSITRSNGKSKN